LGCTSAQPPQLCCCIYSPPPPLTMSQTSKSWSVHLSGFPLPSPPPRQARLGAWNWAAQLSQLHCCIYSSHCPALHHGPLSYGVCISESSFPSILMSEFPSTYTQHSESGSTTALTLPLHLLIPATLHYITDLKVRVCASLSHHSQFPSFLTHSLSFPLHLGSSFAPSLALIPPASLANAMLPLTLHPVELLRASMA
jgi:hypothetical protein